VPSPAAQRIVMRARLYRRLARLPEFARGDGIGRADRALNLAPLGPLHVLDAVAVIGADELDQLCGYAVRLLSRKGTHTRDLADLLGMLNPERLTAIWWALPADRRHALERDPACGYHIGRFRDDLPAAEWELEALIEDTPTTDTGHELTALAAVLQEVG
jgi:hypothetical protein